MNNNPTQASNQMNGEMFTSSQESFSAATIPTATRLVKTPFTALTIDQQMLKPLLKVVRPVYTETKSHMIPLCWYGYGLEPPSILPKAKALAAIDDRNGLQIILCSVDGKSICKDGIPYHMIWSHDSSFIDYPVLDHDYTWPVIEVDEKISRDGNGRIKITFEEVARTYTRYPRILGNIEKRAEDLAMIAHKQSMAMSLEKFETADLDYLRLDKPLDIPSPDGFYLKTPDVVRVDHDPENRRLACPGVWLG